MRDQVYSNNRYRRANTRPRTNAEKQAAIERALKANPQQSDRQVAKKVGVDHTTVGITRKKLEQSGDVVESTTSTDTLGRRQPRKRKPVTVQVTKQEPLTKTVHFQKEEPDESVPDIQDWKDLYAHIDDIVKPLASRVRERTKQKIIDLYLAQERKIIQKMESISELTYVETDLLENYRKLSASEQTFISTFCDPDATPFDRVRMEDYLLHQDATILFDDGELSWYSLYEKLDESQREQVFAMAEQP